MGPLLPLLTAVDGADLIIICHGELFFVHKEVVSAQSPFLEQEVLNTNVGIRQGRGQDLKLI